jgi:hypothetical protein
VNRDSGAIVLGWLTKLMLGFAIVGFLAYDGISLVVASVHASDKAAQIASESADTFRESKDINVAYRSAMVAAEVDGNTLAPEDFLVMPDGQVQVTLHRTATSLWMSRVGALKKYLDVSAVGKGAPAS